MPRLARQDSRVAKAQQLKAARPDGGDGLGGPAAEQLAPPDDSGLPQGSDLLRLDDGGMMTEREIHDKRSSSCDAPAHTPQTAPAAFALARR